MRTGARLFQAAWRSRVRSGRIMCGFFCGACMNSEQATPPAQPEDLGEARRQEITATAARIESAATIAEKSNVLWAMPRELRHEVLGTLDPTLVAALIQNNPEQNLALLGSVPSSKFHQ